MTKGIREVEAGQYVLSFTLDSTVWNSTHLPSLVLAIALRSEILMR